MSDLWNWSIFEEKCERNVFNHCHVQYYWFNYTNALFEPAFNYLQNIVIFNWKCYHHILPPMKLSPNSFFIVFVRRKSFSHIYLFSSKYLSCVMCYAIINRWLERLLFKSDVLKYNFVGSSVRIKLPNQYCVTLKYWKCII